MRGKYVVVDGDEVRVDDPDDLREMEEGAASYREMSTDESGGDISDIIDFWIDEGDEEDD